MLKEFGLEIKTLLRFLLIGLVFFIAYQFYLNLYKGQAADPFTRFVSMQVIDLLKVSGFSEISAIDNPQGEFIRYFYREKSISRMNEGCNAVSVMILFLSFIFAFYKGMKTFAFAGFGLIFLYALNVLRIWILNIIFISYPHYGKPAHDYLFPAVIYGGVVILWLVWIKFFVLKKNENS